MGRRGRSGAEAAELRRRQDYAAAGAVGMARLVLGRRGPPRPAGAPGRPRAPAAVCSPGSGRACGLGRARPARGRDRGSGGGQGRQGSLGDGGCPWPRRLSGGGSPAGLRVRGGGWGALGGCCRRAPRGSVCASLRRRGSPRRGSDSGGDSGGRDAETSRPRSPAEVGCRSAARKGGLVLGLRLARVRGRVAGPSRRILPLPPVLGPS